MASEPCGSTSFNDATRTAVSYSGSAWGPDLTAQRGGHASQGVPAGGRGRSTWWQREYRRVTGVRRNAAGGGKGAGEGKGNGKGNGGRWQSAGGGRHAGGVPGQAGFQCECCGSADHRCSECPARLEQQLRAAVAGLIRVGWSHRKVRGTTEEWIKFYGEKYAAQAEGTVTGAASAVNMVQEEVPAQSAEAQAQADRAVQQMQRAVDENKRKKKEEAEKKKEEKKKLVEKKREERREKAAERARVKKLREREKAKREQEERQKLIEEIREECHRESREEITKMMKLRLSVAGTVDDLRRRLEALEAPKPKKSRPKTQSGRVAAAEDSESEEAEVKEISSQEQVKAQAVPQAIPAGKGGRNSAAASMDAVGGKTGGRGNPWPGKGGYVPREWRLAPDGDYYERWQFQQFWPGPRGTAEWQRAVHTQKWY